MSRFDGVGVPLSIGWVHGAPGPSVATLRDRLRRAWTLLCVTPWSRPPTAKRPPGAGGRGPDVVLSSAHGRLAQGESASFTPKRSLVRSQYRPRRSEARFEIFEPGLRRLYSSEVQLRLVVGPGPAPLPRRARSGNRSRWTPGIARRTALPSASPYARVEGRALARRRGAASRVAARPHGCFTGGRSSASFSRTLVSTDHLRVVAGDRRRSAHHGFRPRASATAADSAEVGPADPHL